MINKPVEHNKFVIQLQGSGFRATPNIAGRIASFWVVNKEQDVRSLFVFALPLTDAFENDGDSEEKILDSALSLIKQYIDKGSVQNLEEYTFEYKSHQFSVRDNPNWWVKSLKSYFKSK